MCAEVLIPEVVPPQYIIGLYVSCTSTADAVLNQFPNVAVTVRPGLFFQ